MLLLLGARHSAGVRGGGGGHYETPASQPLLRQTCQREVFVTFSYNYVASNPKQVSANVAVVSVS